MIRFALTLVVVSGVFSLQNTANAISTQAERQVIRATPLLERPHRTGHFYGNSVRWVHQRSTSR